MGLELGGNAAFIVFESANLDTAVQGLMASKFRYIFLQMLHRVTKGCVAESPKVESVSNL